MDEYLGMIKIFAGSFAPPGWMFCQGQSLNIQQYSLLFTLIGTTFGGDGVTTFYLPDYRGRSPIGVNTTYSNTVPRVANGATGGAEATQMTVSSMPVHTHPVEGTVQIPANSDPASSDSPIGAYPAQPSTPIYQTAPGNVYGGNAYYNFTADNAGSATPAPVPVMSPFLAVNYIICVGSIYIPPQAG